MIKRFSTHGLAHAMVEQLRGEGVDARVDFRPRNSRNFTPFCVVQDATATNQADHRGQAAAAFASAANRHASNHGRRRA